MGTVSTNTATAFIGTPTMAASTLDPSSAQWPKELRASLEVPIHQYMKDIDKDYDISPFMEYIMPLLEEGKTKDDLKHTLVKDAGWEDEMASNFAEWLWNLASSKYSTHSESKASKKRSRNSTDNEESISKRPKAKEDSEPEAIVLIAPENSTTPTISDAHVNKKLAELKAARAKKAATSAVDREASLSSMTSKSNNNKRERKGDNNNDSNLSNINDTADEHESGYKSKKTSAKATRAVSVKEGNSKQNTRKSKTGGVKNDSTEGGDDQMDLDGNQNKGSGRPADQARCVFWPNCKNGDECPYFHPSEPCKHFPNCSKGDECDFAHPPCKFGDDCTKRPLCPFAHSIASSSHVANNAFSMQMQQIAAMAAGGRFPMPMMMQQPKNCKNGFACPNYPRCSFNHPLEVCKNGKNCKFGAKCKFSHAALCRNGETCTIPGCKFAHPRPLQTDPNAVQSISDSLPHSPGKGTSNHDEDTPQLAETDAIEAGIEVQDE